MFTNKDVTVVSGGTVGAPERELPMLRGGTRLCGETSQSSGVLPEVRPAVLPAHCLQSPSFEMILCTHFKIICAGGQSCSVSLKIDFNFQDGQSAWRTT